jgi:ABC-type glycerol-3-phosphate transport system substrate-binding protein
LWQVTGAEDEEKPYVPRLFNDSQDRLYVQAVGLPFLEMEQKFLTAVVGNIPPDVFEYFGSVAQWSTRGALIPLDDLMDRDGFDRKSVFPALWDEMTWDGRTYAIPTGTSNEAFYWNREHFREAGLDPDKPPETWDELEDYALKLTTRNPDGSINRAGYIPGYWSPSGPALFLNWPLQMGAQFVSGDGRHATLATTAGIAALEWDGKLFERLGRDQLVLKRSSYGQGNQHGFLRGNLSMIVNKSSFVQEIERYAPGLDYGVSFLPYPKGGRRAVVAGCVWIGIPAGAKNPEAAWEYIKFCTNAAVQMRGAEYAAQRNLGGFFPANIEAAGSPFQMGLPHMKVFVDSMAFGHSPTVVPLAHTQFWRAYIEAWDAVTLGKLDAATALRKAESAVQRGLDEQWDYARFYNEQIRHTAPAGGRVQGEGFR